MNDNWFFETGLHAAQDQGRQITITSTLSPKLTGAGSLTTT